MIFTRWAERRWLDAAHDGAIVPMIQDGPDGSYDLTRPVVGKVASINTIVAGGSASLVSLGRSSHTRSSSF